MTHPLVSAFHRIRFWEDEIASVDALIEKAWRKSFMMEHVEFASEVMASEFVPEFFVGFYTLSNGYGTYTWRRP